MPLQAGHYIKEGASRRPKPALMRRGGLPSVGPLCALYIKKAHQAYCAQAGTLRQ